MIEDVNNNCCCCCLFLHCIHLCINGIIPVSAPYFIVVGGAHSVHHFCLQISVTAHSKSRKIAGIAVTATTVSNATGLSYTCCHTICIHTHTLLTVSGNGSEILLPTLMQTSCTYCAENAPHQRWPLQVLSFWSLNERIKTSPYWLPSELGPERKTKYNHKLADEHKWQMLPLLLLCSCSCFTLNACDCNRRNEVVHL